MNALKKLNFNKYLTIQLKNEKSQFTGRTDDVFFLSRFQEIAYYLLPRSVARMRIRKNAAAVPN
jgi:hypothetical protein